MITISQALEKLIYMMVTLYIISIYIFATYTDTIIISEICYIILAILIFCYILLSGAIHVHSYIFFIIAFTIYCLFTSFWAIDPSYAAEKAKTLTQLLIMSFLIYSFFYQTKRLDKFVNILCIAGLVMSVYTFFHYGVSNYFRALMIGKRIGEEVAQTNDLGIMAGNTVILCFYYALFHKKKIFYLFSALPFIIAMGTGSRKALFIVVLGVLLLTFFRYSYEKKYKLLLGLITVITLLYFVLSLQVFSAILERFQNMINLLVGKGEYDHSAWIRQYMINFGWQEFKMKPLLGYGMDNSRFLIRNEIGLDTYMHNNFIEILVGGGLIAFIIYYSMYVRIFIKLIQPIKKRINLARLTFSILVFQIVLDYGAVSYYSKTTYIFLVLGFLVVKICNEDIQDNNTNYYKEIT